MSRDTVERKLIEEALRRTEEKYRKIFENATEGIFQATDDGRILSANPAFARIHGFDSPEEFIRSVPDITRLHVDPEGRTEMLRLLHREGRLENYEIRMFRRDDGMRWISLNAKLVRDNTGKPLFHEGTMQDITRRKEAEEALRESEERYRTVVEQANDAIAIIRGTKHLFVNTRFVEMFGYSTPEEVLALPINFNIHPDDLERVLSIVTQTLEGEAAPLRYEFKGVTRTGAIIHIEVSATNITYGGDLVTFVYLRDITERKAVEEALIESHRELERLNRAKSKAIHHISHELRTPLALVQANVQILRRKLEGTPEEKNAGTSLDMLDRHVARLFEISDETDDIIKTSRDLEASGLIADMDRVEQRMESLAAAPEEIRAYLGHIRQWAEGYVSRSHGGFEMIDLAPFVRSAVARTRNYARKRAVPIRLESGKKRLRLFMNPAILTQVLEALIKNAVENTPDGGSVRVRLEESAGKTWIHVIDTGVGIAGEDQTYIFDGLFHVMETDRYSSKRPYEFAAGGKGLELAKAKVYSKKFGFDLVMSSTRCEYLLSGGVPCPGNIASCPHARAQGGCGPSCGSTFSLGFRAPSEGEGPEGGRTRKEGTP
jgi:PAS domain S-box-containing protein